jgi:SAM-dependent methyltransferase
MADSRAWWNRAAREDAGWYIATASDPFLERGRRDTDELVAFCGLQPSRDRTLLEIGAGAGRMTHRFVELYGRVIALDVSDEMLRLGRRNLADVGNVEWVLGSGTTLTCSPTVRSTRCSPTSPCSTCPRVRWSFATWRRPAGCCDQVGVVRCRCATRVRCHGRSTSPVILCMPPRAAGSGRVPGAAPASRPTDYSRPLRDLRSASSYDHVGIGTCGCCYGADAA